MIDFLEQFFMYFASSGKVSAYRLHTTEKNPSKDMNCPIIICTLAISNKDLFYSYYLKHIANLQLI